MEYRENALCLQDYRALRESVNWENYPDCQAQAALAGSVYTVSAVEGSQTVGMGRLIGDGIYYTVVDVVVHPAFQRKGIGKRIVEMLVDYAGKAIPEEGRGSIQLVSEKGKEPFYERLGFDRIPSGLCGSGMKKTIRRPAG